MGLGNNRCITNASKGSRNQEFLIVHKGKTKQLIELNWLDKMDSSRKETLTFDGKTYGVPRDGYGLGLLLNIRLLGGSGLLPEYKDQKKTVLLKM